MGPEGEWTDQFSENDIFEKSLIYQTKVSQQSGGREEEGLCRFENEWPLPLLSVTMLTLPFSALGPVFIHFTS